MSTRCCTDGETAVGGLGRRQKGTGRGNRTTPVLSPGTAQPWAVITNHTSHFWGDISLPSD